jgi:chaperonin GroEL
MKKIEFDAEARNKLMAGVEKLNKAVGSTLGAKGRNVIFQLGNTYGVTKDGATVAQNIQLEDPIENAACQIVSEAAARTARDAGDGTTTSTVLAHSMISQALKRLSENSGSNPMDIKRGIDAAVYDLIQQVEELKVDVVDDSDDLYNIANISSNGDPEIAMMISNIYKEVGRTGAVRLEHTQMTDTVSSVVQGCQINSGMLNPSFATNNKGDAEYENPLILITDKKFEAGVQDIIPAIQIASEQESPLLIICGGMEGETLSTLIINKLKSQLPVVAVTAPEFGEKRTEILEDLATITGGKVISEFHGSNIAEMTLEDMGSADKIVAGKEFTTIIGRHGDPESIEKRVEVINSQMEQDMHMQETWRLKKRVATLTGGIGVIYVGGNSETEMKDSYYRIEDSLEAVKAAIESGYVPGGGIAYIRAKERLQMFEISHAADLHKYPNSDFHIGYDIALQSMTAPFITIVENGGENPNEIYKKVKDQRVFINGVSGSYTKVARSTAIDETREDEINDYLGYNVATGEVTNMVERGIIDPLKVATTAIKNAASVAGMILTTNTVIYESK